MMIFPGRTQVSAPTHHSRELGRRVEQVVRDYQRDNSDLTADEIRTALLHSTEVYEDESALTRLRLRTILPSCGGRDCRGGCHERQRIRPRRWWFRQWGH
jgi:hypothetical protein